MNAKRYLRVGLIVACLALATAAIWGAASLRDPLVSLTFLSLIVLIMLFERLIQVHGKE